MPNVRKETERACKSDQIYHPNMASIEMGVDIVRPLPPALGNLRFVAVALEYFTKWIEAKALAKITLGTLISFIRQRIICRFGVPAYITVDNGK